MNKFLLIIQREFLTRVQKKSFILLTVLMPFILAALVFTPIWLASIKDDEQKEVAVADKTGRYIGLFKADESYRYVPVADAGDKAYYSDTTRFEAVIEIKGELRDNPKAVTIYSTKEVPIGLLTYTQNILNEQLRRDKLSDRGIEGMEDIIADIQSEVNIATVKRTDEGNDSSSDSGIAMAVGFIFTFLIYMFVMSYGGMVMQSVMEEKTNRIVELMVSSVKPFQLMMGKIVGIALVGFVQITIWAGMLATIILGASALFGIDPATTQDAAMQTQMAGLPEVNPDNEILGVLMNLPYVELGINFVLYFIGGYLLYASFFAAVGASVNEQEDSSQFMMPVIFIMIFGLYAAMGSVENTNGPLAFWTSMFPLTSPIVMMVRIPFGVPLWQELLSIALLFATSLFFVWFSSRIYRVGILMYGKKPSLKEMLKWMRYK